MEKHILAMEASGEVIDGDTLEEKALEMAVEEVYQENGQKWRPWAKNARSIRMGEVILIVDSDTVVPEVRLFSFLFFFFCGSPFKNVLDSGLLEGCCSRTCRKP